jgi:hypothetical protein
VNVRETLELDDWAQRSRRNARSVQTLVGWIFWDPGAVRRYEALGLPGPMGYIASRGAPFAGAGPAAMVAAFGSISQLGIAIVFDRLKSADAFTPYWLARDEAIVEGLREFAPGTLESLGEWRDELWSVVSQLPSVGRPLFASTRATARNTSAGLDAWHAVNCLREWRGDTHWALVAVEGLSAQEASILHNAWLGYDGDWLSKSRGNSDAEIEFGWQQLTEKGLATQRRVNDAGLALRQWIEDETDRRTVLPWQLLGSARADAFAETFEPPCVALLARVDLTAGERYQPASRLRESHGQSSALSG